METYIMLIQMTDSPYLRMFLGNPKYSSPEVMF